MSTATANDTDTTAEKTPAKTTPAAAAAPKKKVVSRRGTGGRKTINRFSDLSGGEASEDLEKTIEGAPAGTESTDDAGGITAGLAGQVIIDGETMNIVNVPPKAISPHPFNNPRRSQPQDSEEWTEFVASIRANGNRIPGLVVTREAFLRHRPELEDALTVPDCTHVAIYGHRRRAAALEAEREFLRVVINDTVMENNGDLDEMAFENANREEIGELDEAEQYARYSELAGLGQREIAAKLGKNQATVSRRLSLLLLCPEARTAVEDKKIASAEGAALAGALPFGPRRKWQRAKDYKDAQGSDERHAEQIKALNLMLGGLKAAQAAERVNAENAARAKAAAEAVELIDPVEKFGSDKMHGHRVYSEADVEAARLEGTLTADISDGALKYYTTAKPKKPAPSDYEKKQNEEAKARSVAQKARRDACAKMVRTTPNRDRLGVLMAQQYVWGIAGIATNSDGWTLAQKWSHAAGTGPVAGTKDEFRDRAADLTDPKEINPVAWAQVLAAFEFNASATHRSWSRADLAYVDLLMERSDWKPTAWEQARIDSAHRRVAAAEAPTDDEAKAILNNDEAGKDTPETPTGDSAESTNEAAQSA